MPLKFLKRIFLFLLLLPQTGVGQVENAKIFGKITDAASGTTIPGVTIKLKEQPGKGTLTDGNGNYTLDLMPGEITVEVKSIMHNEKSITLTIKPGETKELNFVLEERARELKTFVTSASKFEQNIEQLTVSMEVLKPNIIENKNTTAMNDALQQVPGVSIVDNEPQIRSGSGFSFGAGSRVMILVDDLPILSGDAGRPSWGFLPVENVEQVEIVKGAASVLYGSAALSGVINIRTAYPRDTPQTKINMFSGVYNNPRNTAAIYWGKNNPVYSGINFFHSRKIKNIDFVIGGNIFNDNGYRGPTTVNPADTSFNPYAEQRGEFENRGRLNISLRYRDPKLKGLSYGINANGMLSRSTQTLIWQNADSGMYRAYPGALSQTLQDVFYVDPFIQYISKGNWKQLLRNRFFHLNNENDNNQSNKSDVAYSEYQVQKQFTNGILKDASFSAGIVNIYTIGISDLYKGMLSDTVAHQSRSDAHNMAAYVQVEKIFFHRLTINAGARYEQFSITRPRFFKNDSIQKTKEGKPVFRAGANLKIHKATFFRVSFGQGYRFPTIAEKYIRTQVGPIRIYPNDTLRPETSYNAEAGIKQGFRVGDFRGYVDVAYFIQRYNNNIEFNFGQFGTFQDPLLGLGFASLNIGSTQVSGWDATLIGQGKIGKTGITILAGYTNADAVSLNPNLPYPVKSGKKYLTYNLSGTDSTNNQLKYRFKHLAKGDIELTRGRWLLGYSIRYNSFMENIDKIFLELDNLAFLGIKPPGLTKYRMEHNSGVWVSDLRVACSLNKTTKISIIVNNLFNEEYTLRPMVVEQPRTMAVQVTIAF